MDTSSSTSDGGARLELKPVEQFTAGEREALAALSAAVYPPAVLATLPGRNLTWARPQWGVLGFATGDRLVSYVGIVVREGRLNGRPARIGGIGSVKTHPESRGRGFAAAGIRRAANALNDDHRVDFSLLVCREALLPYYVRLGWTRFEGTLMVEQPAGHVTFAANLVMVLPGVWPAPRDGVIDLLGPPW